jgi:hypothetical protein
MRERNPRQSWITLPERDTSADANFSTRSISPLESFETEILASGSTSRRTLSSEDSSNAFPLLLEGAERVALVDSNIHDASIATRSSLDVPSASTEQLRPTPLAPGVEAKLSC